MALDHGSEGRSRSVFSGEEAFKDSLLNRMNLLKIVLDKSEKFLWFFIVEVNKQELIELIVVFQVFRITQ
ncbi:adenylosuccinate synthetase [Streptococcus pneumoniae SP9-BS68]|nr:adenylosuccinate synthetase [Streptococcus pneumoniae SP9-BS68]